MFNSILERMYPESINLSPDEQKRIVEKAIHEVKEEGSNFIGGVKFFFVCIFTVGFICTIMHFITNGNIFFSFFGVIIGFPVFFHSISRHNLNIIRSKVIELVQKEI